MPISRHLQENDVGSANDDESCNSDCSTHYITMTSEDLLQPGHVVKERWKVNQGFSARETPKITSLTRLPSLQVERRAQTMKKKIAGQMGQFGLGKYVNDDR
uniref:Uncharacterized protein n=1 Tax=Strigamia maritima TaxID=126957 RepID=T1IPU9_STRMM